MEKEVFERMMSEFNDLNEKIVKLRDFLLNVEKSKTINNLNRDLLIAQLKAMEAYASILTIRIGLNTIKEDPQEEIIPETVND